MKSILMLNFIAASVLLSGCTLWQRDLVLDAVGPPLVQPPTITSNGSLVVFSAFDVHADFNSTDPDRRRHTDYKIFSEDGKPPQKVHNDTGTILEGPVAVFLPAGTYRIVARANGYGEVTMPVVIVPNRVTTVHLEGGGSWPNQNAFNQTNAVRLPDGRIVGWRAVTEDSAKR